MEHFYSTGKPFQRIGYNKGRQEGPLTAGTKQELSGTTPAYVNGQLNGVSTNFDEGGKLVFKAKYKNGMTGESDVSGRRSWEVIVLT